MKICIWSEEPASEWAERMELLHMRFLKEHAFDFQYEVSYDEYRKCIVIDLPQVEKRRGLRSMAMQAMIKTWLRQKNANTRVKFE